LSVPLLERPDARPTSQDKRQQRRRDEESPSKTVTDRHHYQALVPMTEPPWDPCTVILLRSARGLHSCSTAPSVPNTGAASTHPNYLTRPPSTEVPGNWEDCRVESDARTIRRVA
jgi:hypothetical protein